MQGFDNQDFKAWPLLWPNLGNKMYLLVGTVCNRAGPIYLTPQNGRELVY